MAAKWLKSRSKSSSGGNHVAVVTVHAEVCMHCGERLYSKEAINRFEEIRDKLARQEVSGFEPMGRSFQVAK